MAELSSKSNKIILSSVIVCVCLVLFIQTQVSSQNENAINNANTPKKQEKENKDDGIQE